MFTDVLHGGVELHLRECRMMNEGFVYDLCRSVAGFCGLEMYTGASICE